MARYYRRRYTRVVKPKKKWATNIRQLVNNVSSTDGYSKVGLAVALCINSNETSLGSAVAPTPVILKSGNYKTQVDVHVTTSSSVVVGTVAYVMYIPEGVYTVPTLPDAPVEYDKLSDIVNRHPEWILAWKQLGFDDINGTSNLERVSFSSRLKRNLNSGDQVIFFVLAQVLPDGPNPGTIRRLDFNGMCQFWTCAN